MGQFQSLVLVGDLSRSTSERLKCSLFCLFKIGLVSTGVNNSSRINLYRVVLLILSSFSTSSVFNISLSPSVIIKTFSNLVQFVYFVLYVLDLEKAIGYNTSTEHTNEAITSIVSIEGENKMAKIAPDAKVYIYALCCPDCGEFKYVGQSIKPKTRLSEHLTMARYFAPKTQEKNKWLLGLLAENRKPELFILDETTKANADQLEWYWIWKIRQAGYTLLNYSLNVGSYNETSEQLNGNDISG